MKHETKCEKHKKFTFEGCPVDICKDISIKVPVTVCAHSEVCEATFTCAGHTIEKLPPVCGGCSKFNVVQKLKLHIPLKLKAECDVAEGVVNFDMHDCNMDAK